MADQTLSHNDSTVLAQLFDPESSPDAAPTISDSLPADAHIQDPALLATLKSREIAAIHLVESSTDSTTLQKAHYLLSAIINSHPFYASAYNNRAQVLRLQSAPPEQILADLSKAISLATPSSPTDPLSPLRAKLLAQAHTQRGALLWSLVRDRKKLEGFEGDLEEAASSDFFIGGRYGNGIAKEMAARTNPYARLCGAIVKEALKGEMEGCVN
ncbi:hypothetical protein RUND412_000620 [Rhizina undulata]